VKLSLLLDEGSAFTGDLTHLALVTEQQAEIVTRSLDLLRACGARYIHPGHGTARTLDV